MKRIRKTVFLIAIELSLFVLAAGLLFYAFFYLKDVKENILFDKLFDFVWMALLATSVLHIFVSIIAFVHRKIIKGIVILLYTPLKLYFVWSIWVFYIMVRAGGPPVDDYEYMQQQSVHGTEVTENM